MYWVATDEGAAGDSVRVATAEILHHNERTPVFGCTEVVHQNDVGVVERAERFSFDADTLKNFGALQNVPTCALENLTIDRRAIVRTKLRDCVVASRGQSSEPNAPFHCS